mmetsp:Transcript_20948/g.67425  ORF Transcript_20948/g.67425 Transcript_20948/m.67425 type:complete len:277 (-) Transcript_20948:1382-2212(-)
MDVAHNVHQLRAFQLARVQVDGQVQVGGPGAERYRRGNGACHQLAPPGAVQQQHGVQTSAVGARIVQLNGRQAEKPRATGATIRAVITSIATRITTPLACIRCSRDVLRQRAQEERIHVRPRGRDSRSLRKLLPHRGGCAQDGRRVDGQVRQSDLRRGRISIVLAHHQHGGVVGRDVSGQGACRLMQRPIASQVGVGQTSSGREAALGCLVELLLGEHTLVEAHVAREELTQEGAAAGEQRPRVLAHSQLPRARVRLRKQRGARLGARQREPGARR